MNRTRSARTFIYCCIVLIAQAMTSAISFAEDTNEKIWRIDERNVPAAPAGASKEFQEAIANGPQPSYEKRVNSSVYESDEEAMAARNKRDQAIGERVVKAAADFNLALREETIDGITIRYITPAEIAPEFKEKLYIHVHGGAYVVGSGWAGISGGVMVANAANIPVVAIDYRMPPEHPFPAAVDDVITVYKHLLKSLPASNMAIGGNSAGGGLSLASVHKMKQEKLPLPAAIFAGTPWTDLTKTSDTLFTLEGIDRALVTYHGPLERAAKAYAGDYDMKHPLISPVYGDFSDFPPTQLVAGTRDLFLSDTVRAHRELRRAGIEADLNVYEGLSHGEHLFAVRDSSETKEVLRELTVFLNRHLN